jgi:arginine utilization protein RocB
MTDDLAARARRLALLFTSWPSVTGTDGEANFASKLSELVRLKWYTENITYSVQSGNHTCGIPLILKRGRTHRTIVLTGHYDTVGIEDFGVFQDLAFDAENLTTALTNHLAQTAKHPAALADFQSGNFLAGRGLLDMKAGLAAGLAAFEAYTGDETLIFMAVCDEEERSAGARAAVSILKKFEAAHALKIELIINLDAISDQGDGSKGRVVTYGSIGKQLLTALVVGQPTHAGYPQDGLNASYVMSELVTEIELSPALSEQTGDELAAPPSTLFAKDLKQGYNVTTPHRAFAYWNTMQHKRSGAEVLAIAQEHAMRAMARVRLKTGHQVALKCVSDFAPLPALNCDPALSLPEQTLQALLQMTQAVTEPTIVLGFGSIPYPAVLLRDQALRQKIAAAVAAFGVGEVNYFAGISDVSFFGEAAGDLAVVEANTPIWGKGFVMPAPGGYPTINIGPWGRDYHTWLERLHAPYAFEVLPRVLLSVIDAVAKKS